MADEIWSRQEVESPCIKVCMIHPSTGLCVGCNRSAEEITVWSRLTPEARRTLMEELPNRPNSPARKGGRRARRGA